MNEKDYAKLTADKFVDYISAERVYLESDIRSAVEWIVKQFEAVSLLYQKSGDRSYLAINADIETIKEGFPVLFDDDKTVKE